MKTVYLLLLTYLFSFSIKAADKKKPSAFNTTSEYSTLCQDKDLYGLWKVVRWIPYFEIKGKMWEIPAFMQNQWFEFDGKGVLKSLSSNRKMKLDDVRRKLSESSSSIKIKCNKKGFFLIGSNNKKGTPERWRCSIIDKNIKILEMNIELKKGDLIMTHLGEDNTILYFRQLRRVVEE